MLFRNMLLYCITFLFIYGWKVTSLLDMIFLVSIFIILYDVVILKSSLRKKEIMIILFLFIVSVYSLIVTVIDGTGDIQFAFRNLRSLVNFMGGLSLVHIYIKTFQKHYIEYIIKHVFFSIVLHSVIILIMYQYEFIRTFIYDMTSAYEIVNNNAPFLLGLRVPGLTYGLASTSVVQVMGIFLIPLLLQYYKKNIWKTWILIASFAIVSSIFFTGNTGFLVGVFLLPFLALFNRKSIQKNFNKLIYKLPAILFNVGFVIIAMLLFKDVIYNLLPAYTINKISEVGQFFTNSGQTKTTNLLGDMYHFPHDPATVIFGSSILGRGNPLKQPSDVGWVRLMEAGGIIGLSLLVLPYIYGMYESFKIKRINRYLAYAGFAILFSSVVFNFKEIGLFTRNAWSIQSLMICAILTVESNSKEL